MPVRLIAIVIGLTLVASSRPAEADRATRTAKRQMAKARVHYRLGEYKTALAHYKSAYRAKPLPGFLFNIAQCHRKLGHLRQAINLYTSYLSQVPRTRHRAQVNSLVTEMKRTLARRRKAANAQRRNKHRRALARERSRQAEQQRKRAEQERLRAEQERLRIESARKLQAERTPAIARQPARKWAYLGLGLGVALVAGGSVAAVQSRSAQTSYDDLQCGDPSVLLGPGALADCERFRSRGQSRSLIANLLLGVGATVTIGGGVLYFLNPGATKGTEKRAHIHVGPSEMVVSLSGSW